MNENLFLIRMIQEIQTPNSTLLPIESQELTVSPERTILFNIGLSGVSIPTKKIIHIILNEPEKITRKNKFGKITQQGLKLFLKQNGMKNKEILQSIKEIKETIL